MPFKVSVVTEFLGAFRVLDTGSELLKTALVCVIVSVCHSTCLAKCTLNLLAGLWSSCRLVGVY
jgi:hypothetical protein